MFALNKKPTVKKNLKSETGNILNSSASAADEDMVIHTMPKKFLNAHVVNNKAQKTGLIIIIAGVFFMAAVGFALYYFLFKANNISGLGPAADNSGGTSQQQAENNNSSESAPTADNQANQETASSTLPSLTDETATTTVYIEEPAAATTTEENANSESASTSAEALISGNDGDSDGLTNEEEKILGTAADKPDSDGDGYTDKVELFNLYNPAGTGKLAVNPNLKQYFNKNYNYNLLLPYAWSQSDLGGDNSVVFKAENGQFFQVLVMPNNGSQEIEEWYKTQFWNGSEKYELIALGDLQAVKSENGLMVYFTDKDKKNVYVLTYNLGLGKILEFSNLFEVMVKSFTFGG